MKNYDITVQCLKIQLDIIYYHQLSIINFAGIATVSPLSYTVVREESTTTIVCETFGYPPPTVVWSRTKGTLSDRVSVSDSVIVSTGYGNVTRVSVNLTLTNASREDTGEYMCFI